MHDNQYYISGNKAMHGGWSNLSSLQPAYGPSTDKGGSREIGTQYEYNEEKQFTRQSYTTKKTGKIQAEYKVGHGFEQHCGLLDGSKETRIQKDIQRQFSIPDYAFTPTNSHEQLHKYKDNLMSCSEDGTASTTSIGFVGHSDPRRARKHHQLEKTVRQVLDMFPYARPRSRSLNSNSVYFDRGLSSTCPKQVEEYNKHDRYIEKQSSVCSKLTDLGNKHGAKLVTECVHDTTDLKYKTTKSTSNPKYDKSSKQYLETNEKSRHLKSHDKCDSKGSLKKGGVSMSGSVFSQNVSKQNLEGPKSSTKYSNETNKLNLPCKKSPKEKRYERKNVALDVNSLVVQPSLSKADQENIWNNNAVVVLETLSSELKKQYNVEISNQAQSKTHENSRNIGSQQPKSNKIKEVVEKENEKTTSSVVQESSTTSDQASNKGKQDCTKVKLGESYPRQSNVEKASKAESKTEFGRHSNLEKHSKSEQKPELGRSKMESKTEYGRSFTSSEKHSQTDLDYEFGRHSNIRKYSHSNTKIDLSRQSNVEEHSNSSYKTEIHNKLGRQSSIERQSKIANQTEQLSKIHGQSNVKNNSETSSLKFLSQNDQLIHSTFTGKESVGQDSNHMTSNIDKSNCKNQSSMVNQTQRRTKQDFEDTHREKNIRKDIQANQKPSQTEIVHDKEKLEWQKLDCPAGKNDTGSKKSDRENFLSSIAKQLDNTKKSLTENNTFTVDPKVISMSQTLQKANSTKAEGVSIAFTEVKVKGLAKNTDLKKGQLFNLEKLRSSLRGTNIGHASNNSRKKNHLAPQSNPVKSFDDKELKYENRKRFEPKSRSCSRYTPIPERYRQSFERKFSKSPSKVDKRRTQSDSFCEKRNRYFQEPVDGKSSPKMENKTKRVEAQKIRGRQITSETATAENVKIESKSMKKELLIEAQSLPLKVDLHNRDSALINRQTKMKNDAPSATKEKPLTSPNHLSSKPIARKREGKIIKDILVDAHKRSQHVKVSRWEKKIGAEASMDDTIKVTDRYSTKPKSPVDVCEIFHVPESYNVAEKRPTAVSVLEVKEKSNERFEDKGILEKTQTPECAIIPVDVEIMEDAHTKEDSAKSSTKSFCNQKAERILTSSEMISSYGLQSNKQHTRKEHYSSHPKSNDCEQIQNNYEQSVSKVSLSPECDLLRNEQIPGEMLLKNDSGEANAKEKVLKQSVESISNGDPNDDNKDQLSNQTSDNAFSNEDQSVMKKPDSLSEDQLLNNKYDEDYDSSDSTSIDNFDDYELECLLNSKSKEDELVDNIVYSPKKDSLFDDISDESMETYVRNQDVEANDGILEGDKSDNSEKDHLVGNQTDETEVAKVESMDKSYEYQLTDRSIDCPKQNDEMLDNDTDTDQLLEDTTGDNEVLADDTYENVSSDYDSDYTKHDRIIDNDLFKHQLSTDASDDGPAVYSVEIKSTEQVIDQGLLVTGDSSTQNSADNTAHIDQPSINYDEVENNRESDESFQLQVEEVTSVSEVEIETSIEDDMTQLDWTPMSDPPLIQESCELNSNVEKFQPTEVNDIVCSTGSVFPEAPLSEKILANITPLPSISHQFLPKQNNERHLDVPCDSFESNNIQEQTSTESKNMDMPISESKNEDKVSNNTFDCITVVENNTCTQSVTKLQNSDKEKEIHCLFETQIQDSVPDPKDSNLPLSLNMDGEVSTDITEDKHSNTGSSDTVNDKTNKEEEEVLSLLQSSFDTVQKTNSIDDINVQKLYCMKNKSPLIQSKETSEVESKSSEKEGYSDIERREFEGTSLSSHKEAINPPESGDFSTIEEQEEIIVPTVPLKVSPETDSFEEPSVPIVKDHDKNSSSIPGADVNEGSSSPEIIIISDSEEIENESSVSKVTEIGDFIITPSSVCVNSSTTELVNCEPRTMLVNNQLALGKTNRPPPLVNNDLNMLRHSYVDGNWCVDKTYHRSAVKKTESKHYFSPDSGVRNERGLANKLHSGSRNNNNTKDLKKKISFGMKLPIKKPIDPCDYQSSMNFGTSEKGKSISKHETKDVQNASPVGKEIHEILEEIQDVGFTEDMAKILSKAPEKESGNVKNTFIENGRSDQNTKNEEGSKLKCSSDDKPENSCVSKGEKTSEILQIEKSGNVSNVSGKGNELMQPIVFEGGGNIQETPKEYQEEVAVTMVQESENVENSPKEESSSVLINVQEGTGNILTSSLVENDKSLSSSQLNNHENTIEDSKSVTNTSKSNTDFQSAEHKKQDSIQVSTTKESSGTEQKSSDSVELERELEGGKVDEKENEREKPIVDDQYEVPVIATITEKENEREKPIVDDEGEPDGNKEDKCKETTVVVSTHQEQIKICEPRASTISAESYQDQTTEQLVAEPQDRIEIEEVVAVEFPNGKASQDSDKSNAKSSPNGKELDATGDGKDWKELGTDVDIVAEAEFLVESQEISNIVEISDTAEEHPLGEDSVVNKNASTSVKVSIPFENLMKPSVTTDKNTELSEESSQMTNSIGREDGLDDDVQSDETLIYSCDDTDQECEPRKVQKKKKHKMSKVVSRLRKVLCENKSFVGANTEGNKRVSIRKRRRCEVLNTITDKTSSNSDSEQEPDQIQVMTAHKTKKKRNMSSSRKAEQEETKVTGEKGKTKTAARKKNGRHGKGTAVNAKEITVWKCDLDDLPVIKPPKRCRLQKLSSADQKMQETMISSNLSSDRIRLELPLHNWLEHKYLNQTETVQKSNVSPVEDSSGSQDRESEKTIEKQNSQLRDEDKCAADDDNNITAEGKTVDEKDTESNEDHSEQSVVYSECEESILHIDEEEDGVDVNPSLEDVEMFNDDDVTDSSTPVTTKDEKENGNPEGPNISLEKSSQIKDLKDLANAVVISLRNVKENVAKKPEAENSDVADEKKINEEKTAEMVQPMDLCVKKPKDLQHSSIHQKPKPKIQLVHPQKITSAAPKVAPLVQDPSTYTTASTTGDIIANKVESVNTCVQSSPPVMPLELTTSPQTVISNNHSQRTSTRLSPCNMTCQLDLSKCADTENSMSDLMNSTTPVQGKCSNTETSSNVDIHTNTESDMSGMSDWDKDFQHQIQELKNLEMLARKKEQEYAQVLALSRKTIENIMKMKQATKNGDKVATDPPSATETLSSENSVKSDLYDSSPKIVTSVPCVDSMMPMTTSVQQNISSPTTQVTTSMSSSGLDSSLNETPHLRSSVPNKEHSESSMMTVMDLSKNSPLNRKGMVVQINQALHQAAFESKIKLGKNDTHSAHIQQAHQKKTTSVLDIESPVLPSDASAVCPFRPRMSALTESPTGPSKTALFDSPQEAHCQPPFQPAGSLIVPALDLDEANKQKQRDYPLPVYNYSGINRAANPSHRALPPKLLPDRVLNNTTLGKRPAEISLETQESLERKKKAMKRDSIVDLTKESTLKSGSVLLENILVQNNEKVIQEEITSAMTKRQRIDIITDPFDDSVIAKQKEESKRIPRLQNMGVQNMSRPSIPSNNSQSTYVPKQFPSNSPVTIEITKPPHLTERSHSSPSQGFKSSSYSPRTSVYSADSAKVQTYPIRPIPAVAVQQVPVKFHQQLSPGNQMVPVGLAGVPPPQDKFMTGQSMSNQLSQLEPGQIIRDQNYQAWTAHPHLISPHPLAQQTHAHQGMVPRNKPPGLIQKLDQQQSLSTPVHHSSYQQQQVPQQLPHHPQQVQQHVQQMQPQHQLPIQQLQQQHQQIQHHHQQHMQHQQMRLSSGVELTRFPKPPVSQYRPAVAQSGPLITSMMRSPTASQPVMSVQNVMQRPIQPHHGLPSHVCNVCGNPSMFLCSGCRNVWYCNIQCQNKHWAVHSRQCKLPGT